MGLLHTAVDEAYFGGITHIGFQNWGRRVSISPGAHGNVLVDICVIPVWVKGQTIPHGLRTVADGCCGAGKPKAKDR